MSKSMFVCPHCGKPLPNPDKLAWHLSRECPALVSITAAGNSKKTGKTSSDEDSR